MPDGNNHNFCICFYCFYIWTLIKTHRKKNNASLSIWPTIHSFQSLFSQNWSRLRSGTDFGMSAVGWQEDVGPTSGSSEHDHLGWPAVAGGSVVCPLGRESRVALSCVAWNGRTPCVHRGQAPCDVWGCKVFRVCRLRGRMVGPFVRRCFSGRPLLPLSFLPLLGLVSPVHGVTEKYRSMWRARTLRKIF